MDPACVHFAGGVLVGDVRPPIGGTIPPLYVDTRWGAIKMTRARLIGSAVRRVEDPRLITGAGTYIGDLATTGLLHAQFVRSPHGHARINSIDSTAALGMPGVVAVFTAADVNSRLAALPGASGIEGAKNPTRSVL